MNATNAMTADDARDRIRAHEHLHAFISLTTESGEGTLVGVKDIVDVRGTVNTGGGIILPRKISEEDAPVVRAMRSCGCIVVGKTNLHEFAFGITSLNPHHGAVVNPRAPERIPGGSSGGSAAAVAAGLVTWAVGSDTGGSIRIPAAVCGVVGFKPTIGSIDTAGVIPLSRSLDTLGPLAPDVQTAGLAFAQMRGDCGWTDGPEVPRSRFRLGVIKGWGEDLDAESAQAWKRVAHGLPEIEFPSRAALNDAGFTILLVEAASFHRHWLETVPERYGKDVLEVLQRGLGVTREEYVAALLEQSSLRAAADQAMESQEVDALLVPATRVVAPRVGDHFERPDLTGYTRPFNTTGQPVVCLPVPGTDIPIGIQVVGRHGRDLELLGIARVLEREWAAIHRGAM
jgi:Asp-tRNA(Asn)/Glu-tRNA(Gln) amidotransferase A subunit family amidase